MRPNIPCPTCEGSGEYRDWYKSDPARRGGWTHRDITCPKCYGMGVIPEPNDPTKQGLIEVHSVKASRYSLEQLLTILEVPDVGEGTEGSVE